MARVYIEEVRVHRPSCARQRLQCVQGETCDKGDGDGDEINEVYVTRKHWLGSERLRINKGEV